jgi:hypothetical protein
MIEMFLLAPTQDIPKYPVPKVYATFERCVAQRESNDTPTAVNPTGKYRGLYQFDDELADGSTWHIVDWLATWHPKPLKYASVLRDTPMNKWPRQVQTAAFVAVLDGHDKGERWAGKSHFAGGRWSCSAG